MLSIHTSPIPTHMLDEQLRSLYLRRSVIDRLIRALETYQDIIPAVRMPKKRRVA
jgi:hypothetical protein